MKKSNFKYIASAIMYVIGFIMYVVFLSLIQNQFGTTAWWYGIGCSVGVLLFCMSSYIKRL